METVSVDNYGGIFKFVRNPKSKSSFLKARVLVSKGKFQDAVEEFNMANKVCDDQDDIEVVDLMLSEIERYLRHKMLSSTPSAEYDWKAVSERNLERLDENLDRLPQGFFFVKTKMSSGVPLVLLGRKTLSNLWLQNLIPEIFCSQIRADMLLGLMSDWRVTDSKLVVFFHPLTSSEKLAVFQGIVSSDGKDVDIVYPFPLVKTLTRKEFTSPTEGWDVDISFDHSLSSGEEHIRHVTVDLLRRLGYTSHRLYDPACSTGVFLHSLKQAFPQCVTIGQDLSRKMCDVARARVDQVHCGSAIHPMIELGTAHCVFIRFLNSEVVTSQEAELLLSALLPTVAVGGVIVTFGHTPVLLSSSNFSCLQGFELLSSLAVTKDASSIFQYYIIQRIS